MTITQELVRQCLEGLPSKISSLELEAAKNCMIDSIACAYTAYQEKPIEILKSLYLEGDTSQADCTLIGYGKSGRAADIALINGTMISLQLFDDNQAEMRGHPSGPLLPAVLAAAELADASIEEALKAFVIGYEVECRFGTILNPTHYENGWHATCTQGSLAAVAAAGYLLKLTPEQMAYAFGINASQASGVRRNFGTMTMSMHSGIAASNGLKAAQLAKLGFTGDPEIFDGKMSFGDVFAKDWNNDLLKENLPEWGAPFFIVKPGPTFKLYPCGRPPLFAVDGVLLLKEKFGVKLSDVKKIVAEVSFLYPRTLIHTRPVNGLQAKASLEYCIATSLVDERPVLNSFTDEAVTRHDVKELIERIEVVVPAHLSEDIPAVRKAPFDQPVTITMHLHDGRVISETVPIHKGSPKNPASSIELQKKFQDCLGLYCEPSQIQTVLDGLDQPSMKLRDWMKLLEIKNKG